jgi:hypothetical protein
LVENQSHGDAYSNYRRIVKMTKTFEMPIRASKHCRHYDYNLSAMTPVCAKGIDLSGSGSVRKCMPPGVYPLLEEEQQPCPERQEFTAEEHGAWKSWANESFKRMVMVLEAIPGQAIPGRSHDDKSYWGKRGELPCPACDGGTVRWTRASSNGHLRAACTTPNCFSIMQ